MSAARRHHCLIFPTGPLARKLDSDTVTVPTLPHSHHPCSSVLLPLPSCTPSQLVTEQTPWCPSELSFRYRYRMQCPWLSHVRSTINDVLYPIPYQDGSSDAICSLPALRPTSWSYRPWTRKVSAKRLLLKYRSRSMARSYAARVYCSDEVQVGPVQICEYCSQEQCLANLTINDLVEIMSEYGSADHACGHWSALQLAVGSRITDDSYRSRERAFERKRIRSLRTHHIRAMKGQAYLTARRPPSARRL